MAANIATAMLRVALATSAPRASRRELCSLLSMRGLGVRWFVARHRGSRAAIMPHERAVLILRSLPAQCCAACRVLSTHSARDHRAPISSLRPEEPLKAASRRMRTARPKIRASRDHGVAVCSPLETAPRPSRRPLRGLLRMRGLELRR
jgi:hypothetical protein